MNEVEVKICLNSLWGRAILVGLPHNFRIIFSLQAKYFESKQMHDGMGKYFEKFDEVNREYLAYFVNSTAWECVILNRNNNMYDDPFYDEPFYGKK